MKQKADSTTSYMSILVAQCDGKGGFLHIHSFSNAVDPVTNKTLDKQYSNYNKFKAISDKVIQEYGLVPVKINKANKLSKAERDKRAGRIPKDTVLFNEVLKDKIYSVLDGGVQSREDFVTRLSAEGVEVTITEHENGTEGILYVMFDDTGDKKRNRRRKGSKLGTDFMLDHIDEVIEVSKKSVFTREDERMLGEQFAELLCFRFSESYPTAHLVWILRAPVSDVELGDFCAVPFD